MVATGDADAMVFDHESAKPPPVVELFTDCTRADGDHVIAWGWAMAEFLDKFHSPAS